MTIETTKHYDGLWDHYLSSYTEDISSGLYIGTQAEWIKHKKQNKEGWLWVSDTEYTQESPFDVAAGERKILTIDAVRRLDSTAPEDAKYWWDTNSSAFFPTGLNEMYQLELNFLIRADETDKNVIVELTNSTLGGIKSKSYALIREPGTIERASFDYSVIVTNDILTTGIQFEITSNADISVWKTSLQILRAFKP